MAKRKPARHAPARPRPAHAPQTAARAEGPPVGRVARRVLAWASGLNPWEALELDADGEPACYTGEPARWVTRWCGIGRPPWAPGTSTTGPGGCAIRVPTFGYIGPTRHEDPTVWAQHAYELGHLIDAPEGGFEYVEVPPPLSLVDRLAAEPPAPEPEPETLEECGIIGKLRSTRDGRLVIAA